MSDAPWLKFYPSDWRADQALRVCSLAARGLWMEMLCIMHNAEPYGHLVINGRPVTDAQLAMLAGASPEQLSPLLGELESAGVYSRNQKGVVFSRRMTRDAKKAQIARKNGQRGGNPTLCNQTTIPPSDNPPDKGRVKGGVKAHMPESRQKEESKNPPSGPPLSNGADFDAFWAAYPSRGDADNPKKPARDKFDRLVADGVPPAVIVAGAEGYAAFCHRAKKAGTEFVKQATTFLNQRVYEQYAAKPQPVPTADDWPRRLDWFRRGVWHPSWGPKPTEPNCWAPAELLAEFQKEPAA